MEKLKRKDTFSSSYNLWFINFAFFGRLSRGALCMDMLDQEA
jgi:hypothetical protein